MHSVRVSIILLSLLRKSAQKSHAHSLRTFDAFQLSNLRPKLRNTHKKTSNEINGLREEKNGKPRKFETCVCVCGEKWKEDEVETNQSTKRLYWTLHETQMHENTSTSWYDRDGFRLQRQIVCWKYFAPSYPSFVCWLLFVAPSAPFGVRFHMEIDARRKKWWMKFCIHMDGGRCAVRVALAELTKEKRRENRSLTFSLVNESTYCAAANEMMVCVNQQRREKLWIYQIISSCHFLFLLAKGKSRKRSRIRRQKKNQLSHCCSLNSSAGEIDTTARARAWPRSPSNMIYVSRVYLPIPNRILKLQSATKGGCWLTDWCVPGRVRVRGWVYVT